MNAGRVLFLCTGNYYRSRLAEELLRAYAARAGLTIISDSAGLGPIPNPINIGPMRREAVEFLQARGITSCSVSRFPRKCLESDVLSSDIVIGLNEAEHRHMVELQFSAKASSRVRYWHVPDMEEDPAGIGPDLMVQNVQALLAELSAVSK